MNAEFSVDNVSNASAVTGYYYLLVTMTDNNGNKYYHLQKLDPSENPIASTIVGAFQTAGDDGNHYYYTGDQDISVSVVTSNSDSLSVYNAVNGNGCSVFSKNALTGDGYKLSYNLNETDHVLSVNLEKKTLTANPFNAKFTFYTAKNSDIVSKPLKPALGSGYYMLATIMSDDQAIAYSIVPVDTDSLTSANSNGVLSLSLLESTQYNMIDALGKEVSGKTVRFDPSQFNMVVRLYHRDSLPETYLSAKAGDDTVTGYDFWETIPAEDGKSVQVKLYQAYKKKYQVKVHFSDTKNISDNDKLHIKVEAVHATTGTDIYETDISGTELSDWITVIEDRTGNNSISNWNTLGTNTNIFSGNEKVTITLSRKGKNLADGELAYDYVVHYDTPEREEIVDDVNHVTTITDCVTLTKVKSSHDYDYYSILGGGVGFGITADYLFQNGHAQTNFAVNKYYGNNIIEPDLAGHGAIIVIADYELKEGKALEIGGSHVDGTQTVIYLGGDNPGLDLVRNVEQRDWVHVIESTTEDLMYNMVEPIINHMEEISAELLTHETTIHPAPNSENKMYIDLLDFPEDATIYLDGDELRDWIAKGNDGLYITKHKNQMIVFNFDSTEEATIGQYHVQYAPDEDGTYHSGNYFHTESPTGKGDAKNVFADYLAQHVVYNLNSVKDIVVDTNVGMILVPRDDSSMNIKGTSAGWIISDGYVTNTGAEWHSVYAEMPDSSTVDLAAFKIVDDKTPTANQVFSFKLEKLGDNKEWNTVETKQNVNRTVRFTQISGDGLANGWNVFRITEVGKASGTQGNYNMDERKIYAFVRYFDLGNGGVKIAGSPRYYMTTTSEEHPEVYFDENSFNKDEFCRCNW